MEKDAEQGHLNGIDEIGNADMEVRVCHFVGRVRNGVVVQNGEDYLEGS